MNYNDVTVGIVTFKSEKVIFNCLKSIKYFKKIIIFDNSNDLMLQKKIKKKYPNIKFIISDRNLGYGEGNNKILKLSKTKYVFVLSPDTILKKNCENELIKITKKLKYFSIIAPLAKENNYGYFQKNLFSKKKDYFEVDYVKGFAMLFNLNKIKKIGMFDKNIFLYLEEIDLCRRLRNKNNKIYICKKAKITHLGAKSSNLGFDYEKCRNWHWMWSKVYYDKKYNNVFYIYLKYFFELKIGFFKLLINLLFLRQNRIVTSYLRLSGLFNSLIGKKSWYRP